MRAIPTNARYDLHMIREGRSPEQYVDIIWQNRYPHGTPSPKGNWPFIRAENQPSATVTRLRK